MLVHLVSLVIIMQSKLSVIKLVAYGFCPLLLVLGGFGVWHLYDWAATQLQVDRLELVANLALAIMPLLIFVVLATVAGLLLGRMQAEMRNHARTENLQQRLQYHEDLVRMIVDSRPGATVIIDAENRFWFVNNIAAARAGIDPKDMIGRNVEKILGQQEGLKLKNRLQQLREQGKPLTLIDRASGKDGEHFVRSHMVQLPSTSGLQNAILINEDDVTNLMVEREARERMFRQLIDTLVAVVDRRDPYAAGHSARVGQIARVIAEEMDLSADMIETTEIAGLLMNFGKVLVPRELLTKTGALTADELKQVRDSILTSADILALIGFSQPVVPTLRQVLERFDGTGVPEGRKGDEIMVTARIVTIANAFVALVSPRAHRPGIAATAALDGLMADSDKIYDRRAVIALSNYVQNRRHKLEWLAAG